MEKMNKLIAVIISIMILSFTFFFIVSDKKEFSENEFRYLEKFPKFSMSSLFNGKYIASIENYTTDHFPLREELVSLKTEVFTIIQQKMINDVYLAEDDYLINRFKSPKNSDKIIKIINRFKEENPDLNVSMLLAPTATSIYQELLPKDNINASERDAINYYYDNLKVKKIDVYDILMANKNKYQLFYKTDHHWTSFGAYFAYYQYCIDNDIKPYELKELHIDRVSDNFLGTLYSKVFTINQERDKIYKINLKNYDFTLQYLTKTTTDFYQEQYLREKDKYSYFLGTNEPIIEITNNHSDSTDEILIIKDSYANAFIPLLANHYKKVHIIDPRYYNLKISDYLSEKGIKNVLLVYNINNIDTDTGIINLQ